jgi:hypothetical protein
MTVMGEPRVFVEVIARMEEQFIEDLQEDELFMNSTSFREQIGHACRILRVERTPAVPFSLIGRLFGVSKGAVEVHYKKWKLLGSVPGSPGRVPILSHELLNDVIEVILRRSRERRPMRLVDVKRYVMNRWPTIALTDNTLHHILSRDNRVKSVNATPMEDKRINVGIDVIEDYFQVLFGKVSGVPAAFVFNVDEMGHQEWADAPDTVCFVSSCERAPVVYYPVSRTGKRITLIACIAADGSFVRPAVILARKTYEDEILLTGLTNEKIEFYSQENSFINGEIFEDWFKDTLCPDIQRRRESFQYWGPAYLLLDNCTAHHGELFQHLCSINNIEPIFLPPHSSNQLQPLDLCLFGVTKKLIQRVNQLETINLQSYHIVRIVNGFMSASVPLNIVESFANAGISLLLDPEDRQLYCHITPETARCLLHSEVEADPRENPEDDPNVEEFVNKIAT